MSTRSTPFNSGADRGKLPSVKVAPSSPSRPQFVPSGASPIASWAPPAALSAAKEEPLKKTFLMGVGLVFLMFSMLHQIQAYVMSVNLYFLYIAAVPALISLVFGGGIPRSFQGSPTFFWTAFFVWMAISSPFSFWKGGSVGLVFVYARTVMPVMFVIAGLTLTWRNFKILMLTMALAGVINVLSSRMFQGNDYGGRAGLDLGTVANPNDYAAHLLLVMAFLLWYLLSGKSVVLRVLSIPIFGYGIYLIVASASRGAAIALVFGTAVFFLLGTGRQRIALVVLAPIGLITLIMMVPESALQRIRSFSSSDQTASAEALESSAIREYLLKTSLVYIGQHPFFGVGPGQFKEVEGTTNNFMGGHGAWKDTHNTYTQATSECGIPAGLFFLTGIFCTFKLFFSVWSKARTRPECRDIQVTASCLIAGYAAFCVALTFVNFAYFFYMPAMGGFAVALVRCTEAEFAKRKPLVFMAPPVFGRQNAFPQRIST